MCFHFYVRRRLLFDVFVVRYLYCCSCSRALLFLFFVVVLALVLFSPFVVVLALVLFRLGCRQRAALVDVGLMLGSRFRDLVCRLDLDLRFFDTRCEGACRPRLAAEISIKKLKKATPDTGSAVW